MSWNRRIRQAHRWLSLAFTLTVVANLAAMALGVPDEIGMWIGFSALVPLLPLLFTGLYLFVLPYRSRRSSGREGATPAEG